jgi:hypothetical protein
MSSLTTRTQAQIYEDGNRVGDSTGTAGRRRSQRVRLRVPVLIKVRTREGAPNRVEGITLVVSAHGGLLESPLLVADNEEIALAVPFTGKEVGCRVVRWEMTSSGLVRFAFEFREPASDFWPVNFPPDDWGEVGS